MKIVAFFTLLVTVLGSFSANGQMIIGSGVIGGESQGMVTPILAKAASSSSEPSNSAVSFGSIIGGQANSNFNTTVAARSVPFPIAGTFNRIRAYFPQALSQGSYTIGLNVGGVTTSANCVIDTTHQSCSDDSFSLSTTGGGQLVAIAVTPSGTPTVQTGTVEISLEFVSSAPNESFLCSDTTGTPSNSAQNWTPFGGMTNWGSTEVQQSSIMPTAGTIDHFYAVTSAPIVTGSWDASIYKNGSASALDTGSISSGKTGSDLTHSVSLVNLDTISFSLTPTSTPTIGVFSACARFVPTTKGQAILTNSFTTVPPTTSSANRFANLSGALQSDSAQTNPNNIIPTFSNSFTLSNFVVAQSTLSGSGASRTVDVLSGTTGGTINTACNFTTTLNNTNTLTVGGVSNTPANQDNSTTCTQTAGNSADVKIANSANTQAAVTWFKYAMVVVVK